jgi:hypothetical protein
VPAGLVIGRVGLNSQALEYYRAELTARLTSTLALARALAPLAFPAIAAGQLQVPKLVDGFNLVTLYAAEQ